MELRRLGWLGGGRIGLQHNTGRGIVEPIYLGTSRQDYRGGKGDVVARVSTLGNSRRAWIGVCMRGSGDTEYLYSPALIRFNTMGEAGGSWLA